MRKGKSMRRTILITVLVFVVLLAISGGIGYYIYHNYMYYSTDDAQVTGAIVPISAPVAGQLTTLPVKQGDTVTAGEVLATVTPTSAASAKNSPSVPASLSIASPISGTILQISAVQGQNVSPGLPLIQLTDVHTAKVTAYVDESAINNVSIGQDVDITVDAYSSTTFTGHVQQIVQATAGQFSLLPNQDPTSGNFTKVGQRIPVTITLDGNAGKDLFPGMSAETTIHLH
jgi:multidrug resistance efflux pump